MNNLNEKVELQNAEREQQQVERDKQFHEAYGMLVRYSQDMIRELLDEKAQDLASKFGPIIRTNRLRLSQKKT